MALTILDQLKILKGEISPSGVTFQEIVNQVIANEVDNFYSSAKSIVPKNFDLNSTSGQTEYNAFQYLNKMQTLVHSLIQDNQTSQKLIPILVGKLGELTFTINDVIAASDMDWVNFVQNNISNTVETLAGVLAAEKTAYNAY